MRYAWPRDIKEEKMELLYARGRASSTKQPGLLKHRDKRLLIAPSSRALV